MTININGKIINVESSFDIVYERLKQYEINDKQTSNKLIINNDYTLINIDDKRIEINKTVNKTDIYPIVNNVIAYSINDKNNLYIHSVLVSKNKHGILILGDFNSGKSTLARKFCDHGYILNSADQTWICNNELVLGSRINVIDGKKDYLSDEDTNAYVKIDKIIVIKGICTNGITKIEKLENDNYYIKNIFKYANWHYDMPLLTNYIKLIDTGDKIVEFLKNVKISTYLVRGDEDKIVEVIDDRKEGINE